MQILENITISFYYIKENETTGEYIELRLCDNTAVTKKEVCFKLSSELYKFLKNTGTYTCMPSETLNFLNANLAYKTIVAHKIANLGTERENIIAVKKLYDILDIRKYRKEEDKREAHFGEIRYQFEKAINNIPFFVWQYDVETRGKYKKWIDANIIIAWKINPLIENINETLDK